VIDLENIDEISEFDVQQIFDKFGVEIFLVAMGVNEVLDFFGDRKIYEEIRDRRHPVSFEQYGVLLQQNKLLH